jgi:regulator of protease activity HflC (stomatin/prohibitin superfamily)
MIRERAASTFSGWLVLPSLIAGFGLTLWLLIATAVSVQAAADERIPVGGGWVALIIACVLALPLLAVMALGFFAVNPNEARVMTLFGRYAGSVKTDGFHWVNPLFKRRKISLRIRNFESSQIKVNDLEGNPIEIAAVVVWRVVETAEAMFEVENFEHYVKVQTETALRNLATHYPYDAYVEEHMSLRANTAEIAEKLKTEVQARLGKAGVEVLEARINHLAYATEIAAAMLQRQQAGAIIAARSRIVEGAVGMVEMALDLLSKRGVVTLDNERKAAMVSNLLVVLCGDRNTQPVVNTGTIYQ